MFQEIGVFYRGLVLGLMIAAPVGPVGLLCIRRTIQRGLFVGFATGLGAACADTLFGAVAAFSVSVIVEFLEHFSPFIRAFGGVFMLIIAYRTWHDRPLEPPKQDDPYGQIQSQPKNLKRCLSALISSFALTASNPVTMMATLAVVATFGELRNHTEAATIVGGIFCGSALWWLILSGGVTLVRGHFTEERVRLLNRITAVALSFLAIWATTTGLKMLFH